MDMKILAVMFAILSAVAAADGSIHVSLMSGFMILFSIWAGRKFDSMDKAWRGNINNPIIPESTVNALDKNQCECTGIEVKD